MTQSQGAGTSLIIFMASMRQRVSPFCTLSPTWTKGGFSGAGAADEDGDEVRERVEFDEGVVVADPDVVAVVLLHRVAQGDVVAAGVAEVFPRR